MNEGMFIYYYSKLDAHTLGFAFSFTTFLTVIGLSPPNPVPYFICSISFKSRGLE
jgi:hypothetical protein